MTKVLTLIDDEALASWERAWGKPVDGTFTENPHITYKKVGGYYHVFWLVDGRVAWQSNGNPCWVNPEEYRLYTASFSMPDPDFSLDEIQAAQELMEGL